MNADIFQKFKDEKLPVSTASTEIGNAIITLYYQVKECIGSSDYSAVKVVNLKWSAI